MAGGLPADLVEETALTLGSVGRLSLRPEQWPAVQLVLRSADHAVDTDDADALRVALDELHRVGLGSEYFDDSPTGAQAVLVDPMPPPAGAGRAGSEPRPLPPPAAGSVGFEPMPPPSTAAGRAPTATRAKRGRVWVGTGVCVAALFAVVSLSLLTTKTHNAASPRPPAPSATMPGLPSVPGSAPPTQVIPTTSTPGAPTGSGAATGFLVAGGLIAIAALVAAVVAVLARRRSRPRHAPPVQLVQAEPAERLAFTFAPNELVELANRTVDRLVAKGSGP